MRILSVKDPQFAAYGKIVDNVDLTQLLAALKETPVSDKISYVASETSLEETDAYEQFCTVTYGEMPIQIGYCNGHNNTLNAFEYHRDSEINVAGTDMILLLGLRAELDEDYSYATDKVKAFLIPEGMAVELYASTLHFAPCGVDGQGFQSAVVLPKGTNYPLQEIHKGIGEDAILTAVNKWRIPYMDEYIKGTSCLKGCRITMKNSTEEE